MMASVVVAIFGAAHGVVGVWQRAFCVLLGHDEWDIGMSEFGSRWLVCRSCGRRRAYR